MAKEQFRNWIPKGKLKIKYWIDKEKGLSDYWETTAEEVFEKIDEVVNEYIMMGIKLTNRQLYYQLVGRDYIPNADEVYKRICTFLTDSRYGGLIDWEAIEDKDRIPEKHAEWENINSLVDSAISSYRLPRWEDQDYYVELYCEKKAGISVLQPIANKWHIYFGFNKGYSSASAMYDLAKRIEEQIDEGKKAVILYFGDHDPSGLDMVRDITDRITEFLIGSKALQEKYYSLEHEKQGEVADDLRDKYDYGDINELYINDPNGEPGKYFDCAKAYVYDLLEENLEIVPVALTMEQIEKYSPPPNPAKITDPRAKKYIEEFGKVSWELDSLNALELRKIAEKSVLKYLNKIKYDAWIEREKKEKQALIDFGISLSKKSKRRKN